MTEQERNNLTTMLCSDNKEDVLLAKGCLKGLSATDPMEDVFWCIDEACLRLKERIDVTGPKYNQNQTQYDRVMQIRWEMMEWYRNKRLDGQRVANH